MNIKEFRGAMAKNKNFQNNEFFENYYHYAGIGKGKSLKMQEDAIAWFLERKKWKGLKNQLVKLHCSLRGVMTC